MQIKKNLMLLAPAAILALSLGASANERLTFDVNSNLSVSTPTNDLGEESASINHIEVIGGYLIMDGVKAVLRAEFEDSDLSDIEIEDAIREANVQIQFDQMPGEAARTVRAVITGIDIGVIQAVYGTSVSQNSAARSTQLNFATSEGQEGVVGMTMRLNPEMLRIVDSAAISIYNTGDGDGINTDGNTAVTVALAKQITDAFRAEFSAKWEEDMDDMAAELGFLYQLNDRTQVWAILHQFDESQAADSGVTIGAQYDLER